MVIKSPMPDVPVRPMSLPDLIFNDLSKFGNIDVLISAETGSRYTATQTVELADSIARGLQAAGFEKGDVALIAVPNTPEYVLFMLGVLRAGGIVSGVNIQYTSHEIVDRIKDCRPRVALVQRSFMPTFRAGESGAPGILKAIYIMDPCPKCQMTSQIRPFPELLSFKKDNPHFRFVAPNIDPHNDVVLLPYSSGTTGKPKGVMQTHFNVIASQAANDAAQAISMAEGDGLLAVLPFYHVFGQTVAIIGLRKGCKLITMERFEPHLYLKMIQDYKVWIMGVVPPLLLFLAKDPLVAKYDLSSLRVVIVGAAPAGKEMIADFQKAHPYVQFVAQGYGMTEGTVSSHITPPGDVPAGSCGVLLSNWEGKVIDPKTNKELGPNEDGEICVRSLCVMKGYLNRKEATAETIDTDGWLHTGDIGHYDEKGFWFVVDRLKELIKVKGFQVPPAELEDILLGHPAVRAAAVIGVPDEKSGEVPKAFVELKSGKRATEKELMEFVAKRVAPYKRLTSLELTTSIPQSPTGKILRRELRDAERKKVQKSRL